MDGTFVDYKLYSYMASMSLAERVGDGDRAKKAAGLAVILVRRQARDAIDTLVGTQAEERAVGRAVVKAREEGIVFPFADQRLKQLNAASAQSRKDLVEVGAAMCTLLDRWQSYGATLHDLANLCNRSYDEVVRKIKPERLDAEFSGLMFIYDLDYKDNRDRGFIDHDVDAPLTHAIKEFYLDQMINTSEGRKASHEAMEAVFPEIMENALTLVTDADGVKRLIDKDGVEIGTVGEED